MVKTAKNLFLAGLTFFMFNSCGRDYNPITYKEDEIKEFEGVFVLLPEQNYTYTDRDHILVWYFPVTNSPFKSYVYSIDSTLKEISKDTTLFAISNLKAGDYVFRIALKKDSNVYSKFTDVQFKVKKNLIDSF